MSTLTSLDSRPRISAARGLPTPSVHCLANYAPAAGTSLINTIVVTVQENTDASNTLTKSSTSAVNTLFTPPNPPVITIAIDKTNDGNGNGTFTKSEVAPAAGATIRRLRP